MEKKFLDRGMLWPNEDRKTEHHPEWYGTFTLSAELLESAMSDGKIKVTAWSNSVTTRDGREVKGIKLVFSKAAPPKQIGRPQSAAKMAPVESTPDDDIPF